MGTISRIAIGRVQLSYMAASTRKTSSTHSGKITTMVLPAIFSW